MSSQKFVKLIKISVFVFAFIVIVNILVIEPVRHRLPAKNTPYEEFVSLNPIRVPVPENYAVSVRNIKSVGKNLFVVSVRKMTDYEQKTDKVLLINNYGETLDSVDAIDVLELYYYAPDVVSILQSNMVTKVFQLVNGAFINTDVSNSIYQSYFSTTDENYARYEGGTDLRYPDLKVSEQYTCGFSFDVEGYSCPNPIQKIRVGTQVGISRAYKVTGYAQLNDYQMVAIIGPMDKIDLSKNQILIFGKPL